jgi:dihydroorotase
MMRSYLIQGANVMGQGVKDLAIQNGIFVDPRDLSSASDVRTIDAAGLVALPGFVDLHTHLRQPGMEQAETILSGSQSAALGGFTAVHAMANTHPVAETPDVTEFVFAEGRAHGYVTVRPVGAVTRGLLGEELSDIEGMAQGNAAVRVFSDDGKCVADSLMMATAMKRVNAVGGVIAQHAQDPRLTIDSQMNAGDLSVELGLTGWPSVAEEAIIARDVLLAEHLGSRIHICHLSTARAVDVVAWAKKRGIAVTAEVTPHHLLLTEDLLVDRNPLFKVNPPLRSKEDTLALREAVAAGIIDIVATDHAPHPDEAKTCGFEDAAFGMLGLERALSVVQHTLVETGHLDWVDVARVLSTTPAGIGSLNGYDKPLEVGSSAHLVLVDPSGVAKAPHGSLSHNDPYRELVLPGVVQYTVHRGVLTVSEAELVAPDLVRESGPQ